MSWLKQDNDIIGELYTQFGETVAISNDRSILAVGAHGTNAVPYTWNNIGGIKTYNWDGNDWNLFGEILIKETNNLKELVFDEYGKPKLETF